MNNFVQNPSPLVSVIIPTYNHAQFLAKALSSVISQTYTNWEALVINNYSTDNTAEIVESFNDSRIKLINFKNNGIIAASRNEGIRNSVGEYLAFLDSDDSWLPEKLEKSLKQLIDGHFDLVCNDEVLIENDKIISTWRHNPKLKLSYNKLLFEGNCLSTSAVTVKRQAVLDVGLFKEDREFITSEDYDLWLRLAKAGNHFKFLPEVLGEHLKHSSNNSGAVVRHFESLEKVVLYHLKELPGGVIFSINKKNCMGIIFYGAARQAASQNMLGLSGTFYLKSLQQNPFRAKTYAGVLLLWIQYIKKIF